MYSKPLPVYAHQANFLVRAMLCTALLASGYDSRAALLAEPSFLLVVQTLDSHTSFGFSGDTLPVAHVATNNTADSHSLAAGAVIGGRLPIVTTSSEATGLGGFAKSTARLSYQFTLVPVILPGPGIKVDVPIAITAMMEASVAATLNVTGNLADTHADTEFTWTGPSSIGIASDSFTLQGFSGASRGQVDNKQLTRTYRNTLSCDQFGCDIHRLTLFAETSAITNRVGGGDAAGTAAAWVDPLVVVEGDLAADYLVAFSPGIEAQAVPVPAGLPLLGSALIGLWQVARRSSLVCRSSRTGRI